VFIPPRKVLPLVLASALASPCLLAVPALAFPGAMRSSSQVVGRDAYILGPGDQVEMVMLDPGSKDLGGSFEILNDGTATLGLIGSVVLDGLTLNQATSWLRSLYRPYLVNPALTLKVSRPRPIQVSLAGEVESPGLYSLTLSEVSQTEGGRQTLISGLPTVVTAIQKAGGFTLNADLRNIRLQRRLSGSQPQLREARLNLVSLLKEGDKTQNPFLFDGDTILISKAVIADKEVMELAAANLSPKSIRVNVVGEVVKPGQFELQANTPMVQAILAAGGPTNWRARRSDVELVRINRNGTATRENIRIDYSQGVSAARNPPLRDGDTVIVNRSSYAVVSDAIGAISSPISGLVNIGVLYQLMRDINVNKN